MRLAKIVAIMLVVAVGIYLASGKLLIIIALFVVGNLIASGIEKGKGLDGSFAFHRCCGAVGWALMSFYLFVFETLPSHHAVSGVYYLAGTLLLVTLGMYVFATANVQTLVTRTDLALRKTREEKLSFFFAGYELAQ